MMLNLSVTPMTRTYIDEVIATLEDISKQLFQLFIDNQTKSNPDKCHLIVALANNKPK